jgi:hypothetical protein
VSLRKSTRLAIVLQGGRHCAHSWCSLRLVRELRFAIVAAPVADKE